MKGLYPIFNEKPKKRKDVLRGIGIQSRMTHETFERGLDNFFKKPKKARKKR